jgi:sugar-specific transcriptional regulator TrmB
MEEFKRWLKSYGLNTTEINVYVHILKHPGCKVADIQRHTGLVRTTIYYALSNLKTEGLVSENQQNNIRTYRASDISSLAGNIETAIHEKQQKLEELDALKPLFEKLESKKPPTESFVARFEGVTPIKQAIEEAFRCNSKRWHIIASRKNFLYYTSKNYKEYYLAERKRRGITAKTLWEPTDEFHAPSVEDVFYRNPRKLPEEFHGTFSSLVILYDDTTLVIDSYEQKTAHAIHNPTSTHLLRLMHEFAWNNSTKI